MQRLSALVLVLALGQPAEAAHCPRGQIWRVHAKRCAFKDHRYIASPLPPRQYPQGRPEEARPDARSAPQPQASGLTPRARSTPTTGYSYLPFVIEGSRLNHLATVYWSLPK
jgi:hypothetical protein